MRQCLPAPLSSVCVAEFLPPLSFDASPEDSKLCSYNSSSCSCLSPDLPLCLNSQSEGQAVKIKMHSIIKCKHLQMLRIYDSVTMFGSRGQQLEYITSL